MPFKKKPVESSSEFRVIWTDSKAYGYVNNMSGKGGAYKKRKNLRRSVKFRWPISSSHQGGSGPVSLTTSGRVSVSELYCLDNDMGHYGGGVG